MFFLFEPSWMPRLNRCERVALGVAPADAAGVQHGDGRHILTTATGRASDCHPDERTARSTGRAVTSPFPTGTCAAIRRRNSLTYGVPASARGTTAVQSRGKSASSQAQAGECPAIQVRLHGPPGHHRHAHAGPHELQDRFRELYLL